MTSRKNTFFIFAAIFFIIAVTAFAIYNRKPIEIKYTRLLMGTIVEITVAEKDELMMSSAAEAAFGEIKRLEDMMSYYRETSDVGRINNAAGTAAVKISKETMDVIEASVHASEISGGAFDVTMGAIGSVWHFTSDDKGWPVPPSQEDIKKLLYLVDYRNIVIDRKNNSVRLAKDNMKINLGGIAKGYIIGRAAEILKKRGVKRGIIHAGGDMIVFQGKSDSPWVIGIRDPRNKDGMIGSFTAANTAIATSGDYERYFIKNGIRYHHIIDPSTGFPAVKSRGVTVVANDSTLADALSTAIFIMGPEAGMTLIEELPDVEGIIIDADGKISVSSGLKGRVEFVNRP